jgi:hypothetical protein
MKYLFAAAFLFATAPVAATVIEVASGDWSNIPLMNVRQGATVDSDTVGAIAEMVDRGECTIPGQRRGRLAMTVPFLVQYNAQGSPDRVVIHSVGCARAEGVLGGAILRMVENGDVAPPGGRREGWFRSEVGFSNSAG